MLLPQAGNDDIAVVIPAYNAGARLEPVLLKTLAVIPKRNVVVVDDGSTDQTHNVAVANGVEVLTHPSNRGKGIALKTGFAHAMAQPRIQAVITMDADGQHDPKHVPEFIRALRASSVDLLIGCRTLRWPVMPFFRVLSNRLTSALVSRRLGQRIPDSQSGYRLHSRRLLEQIKLDTGGYETESELLLKAVRARMQLGFIPIATIYSGETSHIRGWRDTSRFIKMWLTQTH